MPRVKFSRVFSSPALVSEDLTSQVDGIVQTFTTSRGFSADEIFIYVNGVLQRTGVEASVDSSTTFTLVDRPQNGSVLYVVYQPA
jgi:hypothetical protein